jgi:hypothetical protein
MMSINLALFFFFMSANLICLCFLVDTLFWMFSRAEPLNKKDGHGNELE